MRPHHFIRGRQQVERHALSGALRQSPSHCRAEARTCDQAERSGQRRKDQHLHAAAATPPSSRARRVRPAAPSKRPRMAAPLFPPVFLRGIKPILQGRTPEGKAVRAAFLYRGKAKAALILAVALDAIGAVADRLDIFTRTFNRVAGRQDQQRSADRKNCQQFLHILSPVTRRSSASVWRYEPAWQLFHRFARASRGV